MIPRARGLASMWILCAIGAGARAEVPFDRIVQADQEPQNWMTYSRDYSG